jgi:hypothetical protein
VKKSHLKACMKEYLDVFESLPYPFSKAVAGREYCPPALILDVSG